VVLLAGQVMASMDTSIVNVALPSISRDLKATGAYLQLTSVAYLISYTVLLVAGARWGDSHGHRRAFLIGLAGFTASSLAGGMSTSVGMLLAARTVQGAAAALMVPQGVSLIHRSFEGAARVRALSYYSAILAVGVAAGQVLGGLIVTLDLAGSTWRSVFLVNVPAGLILLVVARRCLPGNGSVERTFDIWGMVTLGLAMLLLVGPLAVGREQGWPAWSLVGLGLAGPALAAFVLVERSLASGQVEPLVDLGLFRDGVVAVGLGAIGLVMAGYAALIFTFTLHRQMGLGYAPLRSGLTFLPYALGFFATSLNWRRLPARWRRGVAPGGFVAMAAGLLAVATTLPTNWALPLLFVAGAGHAAAFAPLAVKVAERARSDQAASLSGLLSTTTVVASVLGIAAGGSVYLAAAPGLGSIQAFRLVAVGLAAVLLLSAVAAARATRVSASSRAELPGDVLPRSA
jgi:MFS family permease